MESNKEELIEELFLVETMIKENPCGMPTSVMHSLKVVLRDFIGKHCVQGASREQVAKYLGVDVRTLSRWKNEFPDFPNGKQSGKRDVSYNWEEIIRWKITHRDVLNRGHDA